METRFKKINFLVGNKLMEVPIKEEFHQEACKHDYRKGKVIRFNKKQVFKSGLPKDKTLCIRCGKKRSKK